MTQRTTKLRSIAVYLQPNERQAVVELAAEARLSVSNYIRGMLGLPELVRGVAKKPQAVAAAKPPRYDEAHPQGASPAPADGVPPASAGTPAPAEPFCTTLDDPPGFHRPEGCTCSPFIAHETNPLHRCPIHGLPFNAPIRRCRCNKPDFNPLYPGYTCAIHKPEIRRLEGFPTLRKPTITDDEINDLLEEIEEEP